MASVSERANGLDASAAATQPGIYPRRALLM
jgi:hypothetical protein